MRRSPTSGSETLSYMFSDHLGGTSVVLNTTTGVSSTVSYFPFGGSRSGSVPTDYQYTGQKLDGYINLYQMGARWYDPELGRFLSPDSIVPDPGNPQSLNRYSYGYNNALKYVDASGHIPIVPLIIGVGIALGVWAANPSPVNAPEPGAMTVARSDFGDRAFLESAPGTGDVSDFYASATERRLFTGDYQNRNEAMAFASVPMVNGGVKYLAGAPDLAKGAQTLRAGLKYGQENIERAIGANPYEAYGTARSWAKQYANLGDDTVDYIAKAGPHEERVVGRQSSDGQRGWRVDYDREKGFHINWWDYSGSKKREGQLFGAIEIDGGNEEIYSQILSHYPLP